MAARLTRLRLYMGEIQAQMGAPDVSADGKSVDRNALNALLQSLMKQEQAYMDQGGDAAAAGPRVFTTRRR